MRVDGTLVPETPSPAVGNGEPGLKACEQLAAVVPETGTQRCHGFDVGLWRSEVKLFASVGGHWTGGAIGQSSDRWGEAGEVVIDNELTVLEKPHRAAG